MMSCSPPRPTRFRSTTRAAWLLALTVGISSSPAAATTLTVGTAGGGTGTVTSSPAGIDCGGDCTESFDQGTPVTLAATPDPGSSFLGWSGDADCTDGQVGMATDLACTATFGPQGSISHGRVTFGFTVEPHLAGGSDGNANLLFDGVDLLRRLSLYYRFGNDTEETPFPDTGFTSYTGNFAEINFSSDLQPELDGMDIKLQLAVLDCMLGGCGPLQDSGKLLVFLSVRSSRAEPPPVTFSLYLDTDLAGSAASESALATPGGVLFRNRSGSALEVRSQQAYAVGTTPTILDLLEDSLVDTFADTGLPAGPGDLESGWQSAEVTPTSSAQLVASWEILLHPPIFLDGFESGDTTSWK